MADRYFVESPIRGDSVVLSGPEAHHLGHVMRAAPASEVVLFDGSGLEFAARVEKVGRHEVHLRVTARQRVDRELPFELVLGVSLPKGDRQRWLVEKAVELGVGRIVPLRTARSVAQPVQQALARLRRTVVEASKQCGRNRLLEIDEPVDWAGFLGSRPQACCKLAAHPQTETLGQSRVGRGVAWPQADWTGGVLAAIGPEGGFTGDEVAQATAAGWRAVDLGPRILRVETAAVLLAALIVQAADAARQVSGA